MAQDSAADKVKTEIDIDNIEVHILILAKDANKLKSTAAFMSRRGWPTTVVSDVQKAIAQISENPPDFVMICVDHPSPSFAKLPDLIVRSFGVECIAFVEGSGSSSAQKLNNSRLRHKISGLASGPNCQRSIRRILAEKFDVKSEERSSDEGSTEASGNVTVRGSGGAPSGGEAHDSSIKSAAATNVIKGEALEVVPSNSEVVSNGKYSFAQSGNRKSLKDLMGTKESSSDAKAKAQEVLASLATTGELEASLGGEDSADLLAEFEATDARENSASLDASAPRAEHNIRSSETSAASARANVEQTASGGDQALGVQEAAVAASAQLSSRPSVVAVNAPPRVVSLLEVAVKEAVEAFASTGPSEGAPLTLNSTGRVAVFPLDSSQHPGYIVLAMQYSDLIDEKHVIGNVHGELVEAFRRHNVPAKVESGFAVDLPFVNFKEWSENAIFAFTPVYFSYEFGVAFFQAAAVLPKAQPLEESNMFGIDVKAISTDEPVTFKAYLHFRKNQKYFLYLRSGRRFQPEQKDRLIGANVGNLYMKSVDVENLRVYLAGNYLRDSMKKKAS